MFIVAFPNHVLSHTPWGGCAGRAEVVGTRAWKELIKCWALVTCSIQCSAALISFGVMLLEELSSDEQRFLSGPLQVLSRAEWLGCLAHS